MKKSTLYAAFLGVAVVLMGGIAWASGAFTPPASSDTGTGSLGTTSAGSEQTNPNANPGANPSTASTTTPTAKSYTAAQVSLHKNASSCWTSISGSVYDLTKWISQHPGGPDRILSICGIDGTSAFEGQHGGQSRPQQILATFKIGTLAK